MTLTKRMSTILFFFIWYTATNLCMESTQDWQNASYFWLDENDIILERGLIYQGEYRPYNTPPKTHLATLLGSNSYFNAIKKAAAQAQKENRTVEGAVTNSDNHHCLFRVTISPHGTLYAVSTK